MSIPIKIVAGAIALTFVAGFMALWAHFVHLLYAAPAQPAVWIIK